MFQSEDANSLVTTLSDAVKFAVTGTASGYDVDVGTHPALHVRMGQTVTFTVQLRDEDGAPTVGPHAGR